MLNLIIEFPQFPPHTQVTGFRESFSYFFAFLQSTVKRVLMHESRSTRSSICVLALQRVSKASCEYNVTRKKDESFLSL